MLRFTHEWVLAVRRELDSPPGTGVLLIGFDIPLPRVFGFDTDDIGVVLRVARFEIKIPSVPDVLESPEVTVPFRNLNSLPLKSRSD